MSKLQMLALAGRARLAAVATVTALALVVTALALVVVGGIVGRRPPAPSAQAAVDAATPVDLLTQRVDRTRERLERLPGDWPAWAELGLAYLELARVTADPSYYPKAEQAVQRSLAIRPADNAAALLAQGALANARHDFTAARTYAITVTAANAYHADAYAVLADAETQLGNAEAGTAAVQRLLDLRPGLSAYARASYDLEQRGETARAQDLMRRALATAVDRHDIAFCRVALGDLALGGGDLDGARTEYEAALAAEPTSIAAQRGLAQAAGVAGDIDDAIDRYAGLTARAPTPGHLLEYAELLRAAGRSADADVQLGLARAAHELFVANGGIDGLTGAALADASGRPADALREAEAEWARRQHADVADTLAWALHRTSRDAEAWPLAQRALATGAHSATYHYHAGMIRLALGDDAGARTHLTRALEINPSFSVVGAPAARQALIHLDAA